MTHEQRTAELALHGWEPVRTVHRAIGEGWGLYCREVDVGFSVRPSLLHDMASGLPVLGSVKPLVQPYEACTWSDIPYEAIEAITEKLRSVA